MRDHRMVDTFGGAELELDYHSRLSHAIHMH